MVRPSTTKSSSNNVVFQLLARRFSSVLSISSSTAATTATTTAMKLFSTTAASPAATTTTTTTWNSNRNRNIGDVMMVMTMKQIPATKYQLQYNGRRSMATTSNQKIIDANNKDAKQKENKKNNFATTTSTEATATNTSDGDDESKSSTATTAKSPFLQHEEWVKFQQSITVSGFQTGQTTTATVLKKSRGGKQARRKREQELARLGEGTTGVAGGKISAVAAKFPAIRYSTEETEELLKVAYETIPVRDGKRGSRNLKRQENRWKKVRKIRSDYKEQLLQAHYRRMEHRKYKRDRTKEMMDVIAVEQRQNDLEYQKTLLKRYMGLGKICNENANENENGSVLDENKNENKI